MTVDGDPFEVLNEPEPARLPWADLEVDYVVESSGRFRHLAELAALENQLVGQAGRTPSTALIDQAVAAIGRKLEPQEQVALEKVKTILHA